MEKLKLILPTEGYADQIAAYRQAFLDAGDSMDGTGMLHDCSDPLVWVRRSEEIRCAVNIPEGWVPATQFICISEKDDRLVGMIQVRHRLNDYLAQFGGHIGYSVHPDARQKGCATRMLGAVLPFCRELGIERVLVTCNDDNPGSRKSILANGGVFECTAVLEDERLERYWIKP